MHLLANIASAFDELKFHEQLIEQNLVALELANKFANQRCIAAISVNLGNSYLALGEFSDARDYFQAALEIANRVKDVSVLGMVCTGLGDLDAGENRLADARQQYNRALQAFQEIGDTTGTLQVQTRIFKLDTIEKTHSSQIENQIEELQGLLENAERQQELQICIDLINQLLEKRQEQGNWQAVAELLNRKADTAAQIWSQSNQAAILKLDNSKIKLAQKQSYIAILFAAIASLFVLTVVLLILWQAKHLATKQLRETNIQLRRGQQERTILERRLAEQQKVDSLATMSAGLLHDFNNYLMAIISAAETGQLVGDVERKNALFESVLQTGMSASELTKSLSEYLGQGQLSNSVCEVRETIQNGLRVWREMAGEDIAVVFEPSDFVAWVGMDQSQLNQIISNIIKNSCEAIDGRGTIRIELNLLEGNEFRESLGDWLHEDRLQIDAKYCLISFRDDGIGMSAQGVARALDPFFSTKGIGRGLGLASANGIIERHEGKLVVQSKPGVGTEVTIVLPVAERVIETETASLDGTKQGKQSVDLAELKILLVEDEQSVGEGVQHYLQTHGLYVVLANDANEALQLLEQEAFDVVVTDYMLRELTGRDLAQSIKEADAELPIVLISAYAADDVFETTLFDSFLAKPFPLHQLLNSIHKAVSARRPVNSSTT